MSVAFSNLKSYAYVTKKKLNYVIIIDRHGILKISNLNKIVSSILV